MRRGSFLEDFGVTVRVEVSGADMQGDGNGDCMHVLCRVGHGHLGHARLDGFQHDIADKDAGLKDLNAN